MRTTLQKVGKQLTLEIPESMAKQAQLTENSLVNLEVKEGTLVLRPLSSIETLEELLAKVSDDNLHGEVDVGPAMGREVW